MESLREQLRFEFPDTRFECDDIVGRVRITFVGEVEVGRKVRILVELDEFAEFSEVWIVDQWQVSCLVEFRLISHQEGCSCCVETSLSSEFFEDLSGVIGDQADGVFVPCR